MLLRALLAAFIGTAMMSVSSQTEMVLRQRGGSSTPGQAGAKLLSFLGVRDLSEKATSLLSIWMHWLYGTAWGFVFWLLVLLNLKIFWTVLLYFAIVWGAQQVLSPALGVARPTWNYGTTALLVDIWHHLIYALATVAGWRLIGAAGT